MPLPSNPDRDSIYNELVNSTYRTSGVDINGLKEMWDYVFGSGLYDRDAFGGLGTPVVNNTLTLTAGSNSIDCDFNVTNDGGLSWTAVAQYWEHTNDLTTANEFIQEIISNGSGTGTQSATLSGLTNEQEYDVRVFVYNKFNNNENYPEAQNLGQWTDSVTSISSATPSTSTSLGTPALKLPATSRPNINFVQRIYLDISASGAQTDFNINLRINGTVEGHSRDCSAGLGTKGPEIIILSDVFFNTSDTVEVQLQETAGGSSSSFSTWTTIPTGTTPSCPL